MKPHQFQKPDLTVDTLNDSWKNGENSEEFKEKVKVEEEDCLMHLGFMLSKTGDNFKTRRGSPH